MTNIICNSRIEYTKGDTFSILVTADSDIDTDDTLTLIIAKDESATAVITNTYTASDTNSFLMTLTKDNIKALNIGDYKYKVILTSVSGEIKTQISGDFIVKWGA